MPSVGTLPANCVPDVADCSEPAASPLWLQRTFAKHEQFSSLRSSSSLSVAKTWRVTLTEEPFAGGEGSMTIHCGQPTAPAALLVRVMPLQRRGPAADDEHLEHRISLPNLSKGTTQLIQYGPICRAGAHIVCVTLNGAHLVGSPLQIAVAPTEPEASKSELRPARGVCA